VPFILYVVQKTTLLCELQFYHSYHLMSGVTGWVDSHNSKPVSYHIFRLEIFSRSTVDARWPNRHDANDSAFVLLL